MKDFYYMENNMIVIPYKIVNEKLIELFQKKKRYPIKIQIQDFRKLFYFERIWIFEFLPFLDEKIC